MNLIVGLGNPGREYGKQRHNIGFWVVDRLAERYQISVAKVSFSSRIGEGRVGKKKVVLMKPETYMNLSGNAVRRALEYFKIGPDAFMVVHDDLDLELGRLKFGKSSGPGGHNGVRSLIEKLGTREFARCRIGIGRPAQGIDPADFVLSPFRPEEERVIEAAVVKASEALEEWLEQGLSAVQQHYH